MTGWALFFAILGGWFLLSILFAVAWHLFRPFRDLPPTLEEVARALTKRQLAVLSVLAVNPPLTEQEVTRKMAHRGQWSDVAEILSFLRTRGLAELHGHRYGASPLGREVSLEAVRLARARREVNGA